MALSEGDISWQILRQVVQDWAGADAELREFQTLDGGSISTTLALTLADGHRSVLKITPHRVDRGYADEAHQLKLMKECGLPVPEVYACQVGSLEKPFSYILMEYVEGVDLNAARSKCSPEQFDAIQSHLAELLFKLHENTSTHFMRVTAAEPKKFEKWPACYQDIFEPIWHEVEKSGLLAVKCRKTIAKVYDRLDVLLAHDDPPRLVHWDVWATNLLTRCGEEGNWHVCALLDPHCKYAHAEVELAYLELFHTSTPALLKAYQQGRRLPPEYHRVRKPVYQLFTILNHLRLFGKEYIKMMEGAVEKVSALV